jgi:hypothetical protein
MAGEVWSAWKAAAAGRRAGSTTPEVGAVVRKLDEVAPAWLAVAVGEFMTLRWPRPERRVKRAAKQRA